MLDTLILNAAVFDGTRLSAEPQDVGIRHGRIIHVAPTLPRRADRILDASGRIVCPGFIDLHSHGDLIFALPASEQLALLRGRILQGITTEIVGNCGLSPVLANAMARPAVLGINSWMTPLGRGQTWGSVGRYLEDLTANGVALNVGTLIGHGALRISAMGMVSGEPNSRQLRWMLKALEEGLEEGAFGLSTGLIYPPGMFSSTDELTALAKAVAKHGALFTCHVRGSSETLLEATAELITVGRASGAHVHHSHHEAVGKEHWHKVEKTLEMEQQARCAGVEITADMFPYVAAATMMLAIYPPWALEGGPAELVRRLKDYPTRQRIRHAIEETVPQWPPWQKGGWPHNLVRAVGWDHIEVGSVCHPGHRYYEGRHLAELALLEGKDPFDFVSDLMIAEEAQVGQWIFGISGDRDQEKALQQILAHPMVAVCTDANDFGRGRPHPAAYGSFVRVLGRYVRELGILGLELALVKMTSYPASILGLKDRGRIAEGFFADLLILSPATVGDCATFESPRAEAAGISLVMVNGRVIAEDGCLTGTLAGQVLSRG